MRRAARLLDWWEARAGDRLLLGALNMTQITLAAALDMDERIGPFTWRDSHPELSRWMTALTARPSFLDTAMPDGAMIG